MFFTRAKIILLIQNASPFSRVASPSFYHRLRNGIVRYLTILSARKADLVLYVSQNSKELFNKYIGIKEEKTRVVHHGLRRGGIIALPYLISSPHNILSVTSILPFKKIENLMEAFELFVNTSKYDGSLLIAGDLTDKKYFDKLNDLKKKLEHGDKIVFLGKVDYENIFWLYTQADIFVFTSIEETFGIPLIEAMSMGLPVIAADAKLAGEKEELFNPSREICGNAALYYNPYDVVDLADKIGRLLKDKDLRKELKLAALERSDKFNSNNIGKEMSLIFNSLLSGKTVIA